MFLAPAKSEFLLIRQYKKADCYKSPIYSTAAAFSAVFSFITPQLAFFDALNHLCSNTTGLSSVGQCNTVKPRYNALVRTREAERYNRERVITGKSQILVKIKEHLFENLF